MQSDYEHHLFEELEPQLKLAEEELISCEEELRLLKAFEKSIEDFFEPTEDMMVEVGSKRYVNFEQKKMLLDVGLHFYLQVESSAEAEKVLGLRKSQFESQIAEAEERVSLVRAQTQLYKEILKEGYSQKV